LRKSVVKCRKRHVDILFVHDVDDNEGDDDNDDDDDIGVSRNLSGSKGGEVFAADDKIARIFDCSFDDDAADGIAIMILLVVVQVSLLLSMMKMHVVCIVNFGWCWCRL